MLQQLLLAMSSLALLAAATPSATSLQYFAGTWNCAGTFPSTGRTIASTLLFELDLAGAGVVMRQDDAPPNGFHAAFLWGPAADGSLVSITQDASGSVRRFTSSGWISETLMWQSDPDITPPQRFSYRRLDANTMQVEWLVLRGSGYRVGDTLRCTRG